MEEEVDEDGEIPTKYETTQDQGVPKKGKGEAIIKHSEKTPKAIASKQLETSNEQTKVAEAEQKDAFTPLPSPTCKSNSPPDAASNPQTIKKSWKLQWEKNTIPKKGQL